MAAFLKLVADASTTPRIVASVGCGVIVYSIFKVLTSPISQLPGPWYSKWTSLVLKYQWFRGQRAFYVHRLHQKYGPCVRVAPGEVHFTDMAAVKVIYNVRESYKKSPWYAKLATVRIENVFSTRNIDMHRRYRRLLSAPMSESALMSTHAATVRSKVDLAIQGIAKEIDEYGATDVSKWWLFMASDIIGELSFGQSFGAVERGTKDGYLHDLEQLVPLAPFRTTLPAIIPLGMMLGIPVFKRAGEAAPRVRDYAIKSIQLYDTLRQSESTKVKKTLFTKVFTESEEGKLSVEEITSNAQAYIIAGTDTTATTMTYLIWSVCRRPDVQEQLVDALRKLPSNFSEADLKNVAYLNHVIDETLRLFAAIPSALPREVPAGGAKLGAHWVPEGTTVCTQAYSMHRDSDIWPEPDHFIPDRWETPTKAMQDAFMPFGAGSRICIGLHLARMELRYATAQFFLTFPNARISSKDGMSDADMKPRIWFLETTSGGRCLVETS